MDNKIIIALIVLTATAAVAAIGYKGDEIPHEFTQSDCFYCHFTLPGDSDTQPLKFTDSITNLCARCHEMSKIVSHQVDMIPSAETAIPKDMPLDEQGRMTCVTCHDIHKIYRNPLTGQRTFFLRRDAIGKNFCIACHNTEQGLKKITLAAAAGSKPLLITSHRPAMDRGHGFANFEVLDKDSEIDSLSLACLDCHDNSPQKTSLGPRVWKHASDSIGLSHPIGIDYSKETADNRELVRAENLDTRLRLFDGKMGCCTCHDPYSPNDGKALVIGKRGSYQDLCLSCHIK
ncbi:MAG: cytochrome c3 family protein [Nitrospirota bacterium]